MLILSIDCAGSGCGVCVWKDGKVLSEIRENMERGQDQRLMPMIIDVLRQVNIAFDELDRIAVTRGPGSFTGIRIGLAAARGIGLAANKPVIGIDRFSIYQQQFAPQKKDIFVIINSRRKELYCKYFPLSGEQHQATMMTSEEILAVLKDRTNIIVTGDTTEKFPCFKNALEPEHVTAAELASIANPENPDNLPRPLYIREPDVTFPKNQKANISLAPLSHIHADELAALHAESFGKAAWNLQQFQSSLSLDTTRAWGAIKSDKVIGFILCQLIPDQSEILAFCVHPSHRRHGFGERLVKLAAKAAQEKGSNLYLEVAENNKPAIALYKKIGFVQTGHRPRYYRIGKAAIDAILFTLTSNTH